MCGFVGVFDSVKLNDEFISENTVEKNTNTITHRGPDSHGFYFDDKVAFGFCRLSIIDVNNGAQPLKYDDDKIVIIFNGEIYNYIELKEQLREKGYTFSTTSDTEVLAALYCEFKDDCVNHIRGMFAFVIWDKISNRIFGARDMFGIKPIYYLSVKNKLNPQDDTLLFASEKKSLLGFIPEWEIDRKSLQHFFSYRYVPEPDTLTQDIKKIPPGHSFSKDAGKPLILKKYWSHKFSPDKSLTKSEITKEIRDVLFDSVKMHMRSDVPVGCLLSSGIDSTIIAAISKYYNPNILTFTIGFDQGYSEIDIASESARTMGLKNIPVRITAQDFMDVLPKMMWHMDDPLSDESAIALYFVSKEASKYVKVLLSGEGSDELFGGYKIYSEPLSLKGFNYIPRLFKKPIKFLLEKLPFDFFGKNTIIRGCTPIEQRYFSNTRPVEYFSEINKIVKRFYPELTPQTVTQEYYKEVVGMNDITKMQYIDMHVWLTGDILLKADKMTMANSIELRVPFLDRKVFEVTSKIDPELNFTGTTKALLREAVKDIIPQQIVNRPKLGFPVPLSDWLRGEMYDWVMNIIKTADVDEYIDKAYFYKLMEIHCSGKKDLRRAIWAGISFMLWYQVFIQNSYDINTFIAPRRQGEISLISPDTVK